MPRQNEQGGKSGEGVSGSHAAAEGRKQQKRSDGEDRGHDQEKIAGSPSRRRLEQGKQRECPQRQSPMDQQGAQHFRRGVVAIVARIGSQPAEKLIPDEPPHDGRDEHPKAERPRSELARQTARFTRTPVEQCSGDTEPGGGHQRSRRRVCERRDGGGDSEHDQPTGARNVQPAVECDRRHRRSQEHQRIESGEL